MLSLKFIELEDAIDEVAGKAEVKIHQINDILKNAMDQVYQLSDSFQSLVSLISTARKSLSKMELI